MKAAVACALAALALLGWAASAQGSTAKRDVVLAGTDQWIGLVLRVPISHRADVLSKPGECPPGKNCVLCLEPGAARYEPLPLTLMADRLSLFFEDAWSIALHEHLHQLGGPCVYADDDLDPEWRFWEEGIVDAVRIDLFPAFFRAFFGERLEWTVVPMDDYVTNVAAVRAASRYGSGSATWRDREARLWRRRALLASWPERQRMIAAAVAARG